MMASRPRLLRSSLDGICRGSVPVGLEQRRQLLGHRAAQLFRIDDGHRAAVVAGHVVADADGDQFDR
jgi:hypothetical protein